MIIRITQDLIKIVIFFIVTKIIYASIDSPGFIYFISYSASINFLLHILMQRNFYILLAFHTLSLQIS